MADGYCLRDAGSGCGKVQAELEMAIRIIQVPGQVDFAEWEIDFLLDYLINVHHRYLRNSLPGTRQLLVDFAEEHRKKFPYVTELEKQFDLLAGQLMPSVQQEEEVIFPYIRQIAHAHRNKESYAALLVRTLRKPVEQTMFKGHQAVSNIILAIRKLTNSYTTPENVCISHKVVIAKLKELDNDLMQHLYLEQSILFPRAVSIEKELLAV